MASDILEITIYLSQMIDSVFRDCLEGLRRQDKLVAAWRYARDRNDNIESHACGNFAGWNLELRQNTFNLVGLWRKWWISARGGGCWRMTLIMGAHQFVGDLGLRGRLRSVG